LIQEKETTQVRPIAINIEGAGYDSENVAGYYSEDGTGSMRGGEMVFHRAREADWLVVSDFPMSDFITKIPWERRILFLMEPPIIRKYELSYVSQFGVLVAPYHFDGYPGQIIRGNPCVGWRVGAHSRSFATLSDVENYPIPDKNKTISVISSLKKKRSGHRRRVAFLSALMSRYGEKIDYYGYGFSRIADKLDGIAPYKYHIAIENCNLNNYWTEKLADSWISKEETEKSKSLPPAMKKIEEVNRSQGPYLLGHAQKIVPLDQA
jgi:hypothetical protein